MSILFSFSGGKVSFEDDVFSDFTLSGNSLIGESSFGETLTLTKKPSQNAAKPKGPLYGLWMPKEYGDFFMACTAETFLCYTSSDPFLGPAVYTDDKIIVLSYKDSEKMLEIPWVIIDDTLYLNLNAVFGGQGPAVALIRADQEAIKSLIE